MMIKVKGSLCRVETLLEWVNSRIEQIRGSEQGNILHEYNLAGRLAELSIIKEKVEDGRIKEIGGAKRGDRNIKTETKRS